MAITLACVMLVLPVVGCGGDSPTSPQNASAVGTWQLQTLNGAHLPAAETVNGVTITVTADALTIQSNGTYSDITSYTLSNGTTTVTSSRTEVGTWAASNGAVTFNDQTDGVAYQGSVTGNALTEIANGATQVYARE